MNDWLWRCALLVSSCWFASLLVKALDSKEGKGGQPMCLSRMKRTSWLSLIVAFLIMVCTMSTFAVPRAHSAAASLVQVSNFGTNPTGLQMWLYVPPNVKPHPAILLALHYCDGTGPS